MNESEIVEAFMTSQAIGMSSMVIYLTLVSGYLIVAYSVGERLRGSQALFISALFVLFSSFSIWGAIAYFYLGDVYGMQSDTVPYGVIRPDYLSPPVVIGVVEVLGVVGCLNFMYAIRRRSKDA